jgi:hypothetical protein
MDLTPGSVLASLLVGGVGTGLFIYGKKQGRLPQLFAGIALMTYPIFVPSAVLVLVIAGCVVGALWLGVRSGLC